MATLVCSAGARNTLRPISQSENRLRQQKRKKQFTFLAKPESAKLVKSLLCKIVICSSEGNKKLNCCQEKTREDTSYDGIDFHKRKQTDPEKERYSRPENKDMDKVRLADQPHKPHND